MNWQNKKITVMGLGLNGGGLGVTEYLLDQGAFVVVTDQKTAEVLAPSISKLQHHPRFEAITFVLGEHQETDFTQVDGVVKNPGIPTTSPYLQYAHNAGVPIYTDVQLFFDHHTSTPQAAPIIAVTGTRGKTTTSTFITHILREAGKTVAFAGNIRKSVLDIIDEISKVDYIVLELSSFQLADVTTSPQYAVITNMFPDHLNRYPSMNEYVADKRHIYEFQKDTDSAFFWVDQPEYGATFAEMAPGNVIRISTNKDTEAHFYLDNSVILQDHKPILHLDRLIVHGDHNKLNATMASAVAETVGIPTHLIQSALNTFRGVSGRQESLGEFEGVEYINDTTSTMPIALLTALETFVDKPFHLICGGENKNLSYDVLLNAPYDQVQSIVLLPGKASDALYDVFCEVGLQSKITRVASLSEAIEKVSQNAQLGERVIFSPGATSFGQFQNEFDRGDVFCELVKNQYTL